MHFLSHSPGRAHAYPVARRTSKDVRQVPREGESEGREARICGPSLVLR